MRACLRKTVPENLKKLKSTDLLKFERNTHKNFRDFTLPGDPFVDIGPENLPQSGLAETAELRQLVGNR